MRFHLQTITKQSRYVFHLSYFRYFIFIHFVLVETMYFVLVSIQSMSNDLLHYYRYCWKLILEMFVIHYFKILSKVPTAIWSIEPVIAAHYHILRCNRRNHWPNIADTTNKRFLNCGVLIETRPIWFDFLWPDKIWIEIIFLIMWVWPEF